MGTIVHYYRRSVERKDLLNKITYVQTDSVPDISVRFKTPDGNYFNIDMPVKDLQITDSVMQALTANRPLAHVGKEASMVHMMDISDQIIKMYKSIFGIDLEVVSVTYPVIEAVTEEEDQDSYEYV